MRTFPWGVSYHGIIGRSSIDAEFSVYGAAERSVDDREARPTRGALAIGGGRHREERVQTATEFDVRQRVFCSIATPQSLVATVIFDCSTVGRLGAKGKRCLRRRLQLKSPP